MGDFTGSGQRRLRKSAQVLERRRNFLRALISTADRKNPDFTPNHRDLAEAAALDELLVFLYDTNLAPRAPGVDPQQRTYRHTLPRRDHQPDWKPSPGRKGVLEEHQLFESMLGLSGELIYVCTCTKWSGTDLAAHQLQALEDEGYVVAAIPDADNPSPALWETAYNVQDDLSRVPDQPTLQVAMEIVDVYLNAQDHETVHVLGHDAAVAKAAAGKAAA